MLSSTSAAPQLPLALAAPQKDTNWLICKEVPTHIEKLQRTAYDVQALLGADKLVDRPSFPAALLAAAGDAAGHTVLG